MKFSRSLGAPACQSPCDFSVSTGYSFSMNKIQHTVPGDLVLIQSGEKPAGFARVEAIRPHELEGWFHCDLLLLAVPPRPITWILDQSQIDGADFTMSGQPIRLERLPELGTSHALAASEKAAQDEISDAADEAHETEVPDTGKGATFPESRQKSSKVVKLFPRD